MRKEHIYKDGIEYKECSSCKELRVLSEYSNNNRSWDKLKPYCKECANKKSKQYREKYIHEIKERKKTAYKRNKEIESKYDVIYKTLVCSKCGEEKALDGFRKRPDGGYNRCCKECEREINKKYRQTSDIYKKCHRIAEQRRRKRNTGNFSRNDWEDCLKYFSNECAYCGSKHDITQDHVVPVSNSGKYEKYNIIPACRKCNSMKCNSEMLTWFRNKTFYTKDRERKILSYIKLCKQANTETKH